MKVGVASWRVREDNSVPEYLSFLEESLKRNFDVFVGPDYALAHDFQPLSLSESGEIKEVLKNLSLRHPDTHIIAGTAPLEVRGSGMTHTAVVYRAGVESLYDKQTDHGEAEVAKKAGLTYLRASGNPNVLDIQGKKGWLHICGDRGRKPESVCRDSDLEITLAHDVNAGFHIGINTPKNPRHVIVCDSAIPFVEVFDYTSPPNVSIVSPKETYSFENRRLIRNNTDIEAHKILKGIKEYKI